MATLTFKNCEKLNEIKGKVFLNKDYCCRKACIKNYEEEERKINLEQFCNWGDGESNKQNVLLYETIERYFVNRRHQRNGKGFWVFVIDGVCRRQFQRNVRNVVFSSESRIVTEGMVLTLATNPNNLSELFDNLSYRKCAGDAKHPHK